MSDENGVADGVVCEGNHRADVGAKGMCDGRSLCRRHLNRALQDERVAEFQKSAPPCPVHAERRLGVTRWFDQAKPRLHCTAGVGEMRLFKPSGRGRFRQPGGSGYAEFCDYVVEIPQDAIDGE